MSITLMSQTFKAQIPTGPKFVLLALADRACDEGYCYPSQKELAEKTSQSTRAVQNQLTWLEEKGFIQRNHRQRKDGYRTTDQYQIILSALTSHEPSSPELNSPEPFSGENDDISKANDVQGNICFSIHQEEPSVSLGAREDFHDFWQRYPKQRIGSKEKAETAFRKALKKSPYAEIRQGLIAYCSSSEVARGFAKGAAAWLNDDRWTSDYAHQGQAPPKQSYAMQMAAAAAEGAYNAGKGRE